MAIILSSPQLELLRGVHKSRLYLTIAKTPTAMASRVNGNFDPGETEIDFDAGTFPGAFVWPYIQDMAYCEVWVGVTAGGDELGRVRLRSAASGDSGVTGTFTFSANNIDWIDNAHITVKLDFRMRPRFPKIDAGTETFYKEWGALAYSDQNAQPPPVVIAGTHMAFFSNGSPPDVGQLAVDLSNSYATAQGATISNYEAYGIRETGDNLGDFVAGPTPTGILSVVVAGQAWCRYEVTDSNGKTQVSWRFLSVHSPDPTDSDYPITEFDNLSVSGSWEEGGWKANLTLRNADDTQFDDGALCILWAETDYDGDDECVTLLPGSLDVLGYPSQNNKVILAGYIRRETIDQARDTGVGGVPVEITTVENVLRQHYQFSMSLEVVPGAPDTWWKYEEWMTAGRAVHHFWKWHTSLLETADVIGLTDNALGRAYAEIEDGTFYTMPDDFLRNASIRCHVTCDKGGRIHITPEIQLLRDAERNALDTVFAILPDDTSGLVSLTHRPENQIPFVEVSGFSFGGAFDADSRPIVTPLCAIAPGDVPDDDGPTPATLERQTLENQAHANAIAGRYYAWQNNEWPEVRITSPGNYVCVLEPAIAVWYTISIAATDTLFDEKLVWVDKRMILRSVSYTFDGNLGTLRPQMVFEPEATGPDGVPKNCPIVPDDGGGGEPEEVPSEGGPAIITGASAWYLPLAEQIWDERSEDDVLDIVSDPWWRIVTSSTDPANCIIIRCGPGYIARSTDAGLTWDDVTPPNPPNCMGDDPAPTSIGISFIRRDASYINQGTHVFLAVNISPGGDYRTWVAYTDDDCATYTWVCLNTPGGTPGWGAEEIVGGVMFRASVLENYSAGQTLRVMAKLSDTRFFFMFRGGPGIGCIIGEKQPDNSITLGAIEYLDTDAVGVTPFLGACVLIDTDSVAMVYGDGFFLYGATATISGFGISFSAQTMLGDAAADIPDGAFNSVFGCPNLCSVSGGVTILAAATGVTIGGALSPGVGAYAKVVEWTGAGVIDQGGWQIGATTHKYESVDIAKVDSEHAILMLGEISGNPLVSPGHRTIRAVMVEMNELNLIWGDLTTVFPVGAESSQQFGAGATIAMSGNTGIAVFKTLAGAVGIKSIGASPDVLGISVGDLTNLSTTDGGNKSAFVAHWLGAGKYLITCANGTNDARIWFTTGTVETDVVDHVAADNEHDLSSTPLATGEFVLSFGPTTLIAYSGSGSGTINTIRGRDIRIGRGAGELIYVTARNDDDDKNTLFTLDLTPALIDQVDISESATDSTYIEVDWDDDSHFFLYGRMIDPAIGLTHIAESTDGGATLVDYESGWGGSFCGALRIMNGNIYAIRNVDGEALLYVNGTLRATIPFPSEVRPRGMVVSVKGTIFVAAADANSTMVLMSRSPYNVWTNITYNHAVDEGVWAIDIV